MTCREHAQHATLSLRIDPHLFPLGPSFYLDPFSFWYVTCLFPTDDRRKTQMKDEQELDLRRRVPILSPLKTRYSSLSASASRIMEEKKDGRLQEGGPSSFVPISVFPVLFSHV